MASDNVIPFPREKPLTPGRVLANVRAQNPMAVVCAFVAQDGRVYVASCEPDYHQALGILARAQHHIQKLIDYCESHDVDLGEI